MVVFSPKLELITLEVFLILNDSVVLLNPNFSVSSMSISCSLFKIFFGQYYCFIQKSAKGGLGFLAPPRLFQVNVLLLLKMWLGCLSPMPGKGRRSCLCWSHGKQQLRAQGFWFRQKSTGLWQNKNRNLNVIE